DLFVSDAVGGPALAGGEHLGEFLRGGLDPLAQRVEAPEGPWRGDGGGGRPHFGDDLEADIVGELDEAPGRGLITVAVGVAEQQRRGRVRGLRTGDGVVDGADGIEVGQGYGAVERSLCHGQGSLVRVPFRILGRRAHSRFGGARGERRTIPPHCSV